MEESEKLNLTMVGERVKEVREAKRLSQSALGQKIYRSQNAINKIEHGKVAKVNIDIIRSIAEVCGCSEDYLLLRTIYKTRREEIKAVIGQMQDHDIMIMSFIQFIAESSGYKLKEAGRENVSQDDLLSSPYLVFEKGGVSQSLTMRETNDFINSVERHAALSLQMMLEKRMESD